MAAFATVPASASALTLGSLDPRNTDPGGGGLCVASKGNTAQVSTAPTSPIYTVPQGGGTITSWSTRWGTASSSIVLQIWRRAHFSDTYTLVAEDSETLSPGSIGVSTYPVSITVKAGDLLGLGWPTASTVHCAYSTGNDADEVLQQSGTTPTVGSDLTFFQTVADDLLNAQVNLQQTADLAINQATSASHVVAGNPVDFLLRASDAGPSPTSATVTDTLPAGMKFFSAVASGGSCSGTQTVTCQVPLAVGGSQTISVVATASAPGNQTNTATVTSSATDTTPADNTTSASVQVVSIPKLGHVSKSRAKRTLKFKFTLDQAATITVLIKHKGVTVRTITKARGAGTNTIKVKHLAKGHYKAVITATDAAGTSGQRTVKFTVR